MSQPSGLKALSPEQISRIDRALADIGDHGEVRLIIVGGQLRFIEKLSSESALPTPADFERERRRR